jgi:hypothetical protein
VTNGHVAEWLRSGLQNRLPRFNSGRGLQLQIKKHDRFRTMGDAQWRRGENHRTVTLAG